MKEYILTALGVAFAAAAVTALTPEGKNGSLAGHVKLLTSLALLCTLITPVMSFAESLVSFSRSPPTVTVGGIEPDDALRDKLNTLGAEEAAAFIKETLCDEFGIKDSNVSVTVITDAAAESFTIQSVTVKLSGIAVTVDPRKIEARIEELTAAECFCTLG